MITASQPKNILSLVGNINFRKTQGRRERGQGRAFKIGTHKNFVKLLLVNNM